MVITQGGDRLPKGFSCEEIEGSFILPFLPLKKGQWRKNKSNQPNILKLLKQAKQFKELLDKGRIKSRAELSRKYKMSRARVTQIMKLNDLPAKIIRKIKKSPKKYSERMLRNKNEKS